MTASSIFLPFGRFQSNGTATLAHSKWCPWLSAESQLVHAIPGASGAGRPAAIADDVLTDPAIRHSATTAEAAVRSSTSRLMVRPSLRPGGPGVTVRRSDPRV